MDVEEPTNADPLQELLLRALSTHAGGAISLSSLLLCDAQSKRIMDMGSPQETDTHNSRSHHVLELVCDLGFGSTMIDPDTSALQGVVLRS